MKRGVREDEEPPSQVHELVASSALRGDELTRVQLDGFSGAGVDQGAVVVLGLGRR